jgi:hypothetical protein
MDGGWVGLNSRILAWAEIDNLLLLCILHSRVCFALIDSEEKISIATGMAGMEGLMAA